VVADVRRVVHDLRPPALDDLGLVGALRQHAAVLDAQRLRVDVHGDAGRLPAGVEVAAFRIASALLDQSARLGSGCDLVLSVTEDQLVLVAVGSDPGALLERVRDRALEVGGRCEASDGSVRVTLPVRRAP
jgi:two-component system NarL family sensor kinase